MERMRKALSRLLVTVVLCAPAGVLAEPAILSLARSCLGPKEALDAIRSIHYTGKLDRTNRIPGRAPDVSHSDLDMVFAQPMRQKLVLRSAKFTITTALDDNDGWDWYFENDKPAVIKVRRLSEGGIRALRENTWANLYYYQVPKGGSIEDRGGVTQDGVACERVDFTYGTGAPYERYFARDTGRLVLTVIGNQTIRESGEIRVGGIRFPKVITSRLVAANGAQYEAVSSFDSIVINETLDAGLFAPPSSSHPNNAAPAHTP